MERRAASSSLSCEDEKNSGLNLKATELRLSLPGFESPERKPVFGKYLEKKTNIKGLVSGAKRGFSDTSEKNTNAAKNTNVDGDAKSAYVKVCMDGAPYWRKVDLKTLSNYSQLGSALEKMFRIGQGSSQGGEGGGGLSLKDVIHGSDYVLTYQDEDGDWMLAGDVPWEMFTNTCKRLRITKGSVAFGIG